MTSFVVESRADLRRLFFRLLGVSPRDGITSQYDSEVEEAIHYFIQHGLWNAQFWIINFTRANLWRTQAPLTFTTDATTGLQYMTLPTDFIRMAGDRERSALHTNSLNSEWGTLIEPTDARVVQGSRYWIENERLYLARNANPPSGLVMDYFYQHPLLDEDDPIDFPQPICPFIAAEAAWLALQESWVPLDDPDTEKRVNKTLNYWREVSFRRYGRRTQEPSKFTPRRTSYATNRF